MLWKGKTKRRNRGEMMKISKKKQEKLLRELSEVDKDSSIAREIYDIFYYSGVDKEEVDKRLGKIKKDNKEVIT